MIEKQPTKNCIRDVVDFWTHQDSKSWINWPRQLKDAGYHGVNASYRSLTHWSDMHEWCCQQFGERHYVWVGHIFWFETKKAATLFALKWG